MKLHLLPPKSPTSIINSLFYEIALIRTIYREIKKKLSTFTGTNYPNHRFQNLMFFNCSNRMSKRRLKSEFEDKKSFNNPSMSKSRGFELR